MSMFDKAKSAPKSATPKKSGKVKQVVQVDGLQTYAYIDYIEKALKTLKGTFGDNLKEIQMGIFRRQGLDQGKKPDNFDAIDGLAEASMQLRKRTTLSPLTEDEIALLDAASIPYNTIENVSTTFIINPAYAAQSDLLERVSKALEKVKGIPEDFIIYQEDKKAVVADNSMDVLFATRDASKIEAILPILSTPSIRPKTTASAEVIFAAVAALLDTSEVGEDA